MFAPLTGQDEELLDTSFWPGKPPFTGSYLSEERKFAGRNKPRRLCHLPKAAQTASGRATESDCLRLLFRMWILLI